MKNAVALLLLIGVTSCGEGQPAQHARLLDADGMMSFGDALDFVHIEKKHRVQLSDFGIHVPGNRHVQENKRPILPQPHHLAQFITSEQRMRRLSRKDDSIDIAQQGLPLVKINGLPTQFGTENLGSGSSSVGNHEVNPSFGKMSCHRRSNLPSSHD